MIQTKPWSTTLEIADAEWTFRLASKTPNRSDYNLWQANGPAGAVRNYAVVLWPDEDTAEVMSGETGICWPCHQDGAGYVTHGQSLDALLACGAAQAAAAYWRERETVGVTARERERG